MDSSLEARPIKFSPRAQYTKRWSYGMVCFLASKQMLAMSKVDSVEPSNGP